eukprot:366000-Chlamydomonas_euryale.AAC.39
MISSTCVVLDVLMSENHAGPCMMPCTACDASHTQTICEHVEQEYQQEDAAAGAGTAAGAPEQRTR